MAYKKVMREGDVEVGVLVKNYVKFISLLIGDQMDNYCLY